MGSWGSRPTKVIGRPAPGASRVLPSGGASRCCWRGRCHREGFFLESLREVLLHRAKWIVLAGFWRNVRDYLLIGHGLMVMECWWNQWRFWGIDGNKVWSLGFLKRRRRVRDSFSRRETPSHLAELDSRWVKQAVPRSWASLGLAQVRPTYRSVDPVWAPVGPSLHGSTGMVVCLRDTMGPPALVAYMALFEHKYGID